MAARIIVALEALSRLLAFSSSVFKMVSLELALVVGLAAVR